MPSQQNLVAYLDLAQQIEIWAQELGFQGISISSTNVTQLSEGLQNWLAQKFHGEMHYLEQHAHLRAYPEQLVPGTIRIISARCNYWPSNAAPADSILSNPNQAYLSRYALGRDYHKVLRQRLQKLANRIETVTGPFRYRAFADSAPVFEVGLAEKAGLGWRGKNTLLIHRSAGSYFFLGEIYTNLPLPTTPNTTEHCGSCTKCLTACPTGAIVAPYQLDARRCISYLTIELKGSIPLEFRPLIGNRIYGCDDCQLVCPWNKYAQLTTLPDFQARHGLDAAELLTLFAWTENVFLKNTEGSPIRRIGYLQWLRNLAVGLGNAPHSPAIVQALWQKLPTVPNLVQEHIHWALEQQESRCLP